MSTQGTAREGFGQAGKPDMQLGDVRWESRHFQRGLRTTPKPLLMYHTRVLYIQWEKDPLLLTPLPLYGESLTPAIKSRSEGNSFLMYKPGRDWFPIALHLQQETPGLQAKWSHVMDYCTLWMRAEREVQLHYRLPPSYFHDDPRFRAAWMEGATNFEPLPLSRRQRKRLVESKKRKWDPIADELADSIEVKEGAERLSPNEAEPMTDTPMESGEESDTAEELGVSLYPAIPTEGSSTEKSCPYSSAGEGEESGAKGEGTHQAAVNTGEWTEEELVHPGPPGKLLAMQSPHIEIEWALTTTGQQYLIRRGEEVELGMMADHPQERLASRKKAVRRSPLLEKLESQCTFCRCGMYPPSITSCRRCLTHWMHTACSPLELNESHAPSFLCSGCRQLKSCPRRIDGEVCRGCDESVVDHESSVRCTRCCTRWHILCLAGAYPKTLGGLTASVLAAQRATNGGIYLWDGTPQVWTCPQCTPTLRQPTPMRKTCQPVITLPLDRAAGRISVALGQSFGLKLSEEHLPMLCYWRREALTKGSRMYRETKQLVMTMWGEQTDHLNDLETLLAAKDVHNLTLSTGTEMGSQLLQFVVFGQTKQQGPPIILLQGVQQALRGRGLGTWALQFLYDACGGSRELLTKAYVREGYMDFLRRKGFIPRNGGARVPSEDERYCTIGKFVWKRPAIQGPFFGPTLRSVVPTYTMSATCSGEGWKCPSRVGFTKPVGKNSCFAHALLQMILGVPQLVAFFASQDWPSGSMGALLDRCLALLWLSEDDVDGPAVVELLRARADGNFGQNYHQLHRQAKGAGKYTGQQDPAELWSSILKELTGDRVLEIGDSEGGGATCGPAHTAGNDVGYPEHLRPDLRPLPIGDTTAGDVDGVAASDTRK